MALSLQGILNQRYGTRKLLQEVKWHTHDTSISAGDLNEEKEPHIRNKLKDLATQIVANPDSILAEFYDDFDRVKDWQALLKKDVIGEGGDILPLDTRSRPGHKILDFHMPHFWEVQNHRGFSVRQLLTQERVEKALMSNLMLHSTPYTSEIRRMITMTSGLGNVTKYRTTTSKAIIQYFGARRILDPCTGWGGRMLGTLAADDHAEYVGCEPDQRTVAGIKAILADTAIPASARARAKVFPQAVELALEQIKQEDKFDMILTSPPYYNLELYAGPEQSTTKFPTWAEWSENWLKPVILGCLSCLREGATSCWSVKNFRSDKTYPLADFVKKVHTDADWRLIKTVRMKGSARPGGYRIQEGVETRESEEDTFCFKKVEE